MIWGLLNWRALWVENKMFCLIQEDKQKESESVHEYVDPLFDIKLSYWEDAVSEKENQNYANLMLR